MKKSLLLVIFLFLSIQTIYSQCGIGYNYDSKNITDLDKRELKGKIKSVIYSHFEIQNKFGEISKGTKKCEQEILFNEDATVNRTTKYNSQGDVEYVEIHDYDNGAIKSISHYNSKGVLVAKTAYITQGSNVREQRFISDGSLNDQYYIRSYDIQGNMIKEVWKYNENPKKSQTTTYQYDKYNRVIKSVQNDGDIFMLNYKDNYSKFPFNKEKLNTLTKKFEIDESYEFDSSGNLVKKIDLGKLLRSYEYKYDYNNNWIEKTVYNTEAKITYEIIERKINYY